MAIWLIQIKEKAKLGEKKMIEMRKIESLIFLEKGFCRVYKKQTL